MPHLTLEYTNNLQALQPHRVLLALNRALAAAGHFEDADIKSRAIGFDTWCIGTSADEQAFVHIKLAILSGRSMLDKNALSSALLRVLCEECKDMTKYSVQLCVEVQEIERESYTKKILPSV